MLDIDELKLPPPTPANVATARRVPKPTPGCNTKAAAMEGISSSAAAMIVQLRPPNRRTASVYGRRRNEPTAAGIVVRRNFCDGSKPYSGPRKRTKTDHIVHTEKPMCSEMIEKIRLRRATAAPVRSQNVL